MKLERLRYGNLKDITNSTLIKLTVSPDLTIWYSFSTPIAVCHKGVYFANCSTYSTTTGKHMRAIIKEIGSDNLNWLEHSQMDQLVDKLTHLCAGGPIEYYMGEGYMDQQRGAYVPASYRRV